MPHADDSVFPDCISRHLASPSHSRFLTDPPALTVFVGASLGLVFGCSHPCPSVPVGSQGSVGAAALLYMEKPSLGIVGVQRADQTPSDIILQNIPPSFLLDSLSDFTLFN